MNTTPRVRARLLERLVMGSGRAPDAAGAGDTAHTVRPTSAGRRIGRQLRLARSSLAFLAFNATSLGLWAIVAPHSWFDSFPGAGHHWVGLDGPYNRHLASDVGALSLALAVVTIAAIASSTQAMVRTAGVAWLVTSLPHFVYHLGHGGELPRVDQLASLGGIALELVLASVCVVAAPPSTITPAPEHAPASPAQPRPATARKGGR